MHILVNAGTIVEPGLTIVAISLIGAGYFTFNNSEVPVRAYFSGLTGGLGSICLTQAVAIGRAGPAASLSLLQTPIAVLLNAFIEL